MTLTLILLLLLIGLASGMLSGFVGVGGGIIIVPALILVMAMGQKEAQGTSLAVLLLPLGFFAVKNYYDKGLIDIRVALVVGVGFVVGAYFGSKFAISLPVATLKRVFAFFLIIIGAQMLFFSK